MPRRTMRIRPRQRIVPRLITRPRRERRRSKPRRRPSKLRHPRTIWLQPIKSPWRLPVQAKLLLQQSRLQQSQPSRKNLPSQSRRLKPLPLPRLSHPRRVQSPILTWPSKLRSPPVRRFRPWLRYRKLRRPSQWRRSQPSRLRQPQPSSNPLHPRNRPRRRLRQRRPKPPRPPRMPHLQRRISLQYPPNRLPLPQRLIKPLRFNPL